MKYRHHHIKPKIKKLRHRKSIFQRPLLWVMAFCLVLVFANLYLLLLSEKFQVKEIEVSGNEKITEQEIQNLVWEKITAGFLGISSQSIFLANKDVAKKELLQKFALLEQVTIEKKFPAAILLSVKERTRAAVFCNSSNDCFYVDIYGVAFERAHEPFGDMMVIVSGKKEIKIGDSIIPQKDIEGLVKIQNTLHHQFELGIKNVRMGDVLVMTISEGWEIHFDLAQDLEKQLSKLTTLLKDQISAEERVNLHYIYLQYKDRAYYQ